MDFFSLIPHPTSPSSPFPTSPFLFYFLNPTVSFHSLIALNVPTAWRPCQHGTTGPTRRQLGIHLERVQAIARRVAGRVDGFDGRLLEAGDADGRGPVHDALGGGVHVCCEEDEGCAEKELVLC